MREIVSLQIGQCGNQIGTKFWEQIGKEHGLTVDGIFKGNDIQRERLGVYYTESSSSRFVPRSLCIDLEPGTLDTLRQSSMGSLFKPDSYIFRHASAGNNWAKGHYTEGSELCEDILNLVRKEVENCDCLQGFQITHSLGGGTGSGLGTLLLTKLRDEYFDKIINTFSVVPSPKVSDTVVEPYNATLSFHKLLDNTTMTFCIDNEALFNISSNVLQLPRVDFYSLNAIIASVMSGVTCSLRFPGQLNQDLRKMATNLVPYQRLHFFVSSIAPLTSLESKDYQTLSIQDIVQQMFDSRNSLVDFDPKKGKYFAANCILRGNISTHDAEEQVNKLQEKNPDKFIPWIPNKVKVSVCDVPPPGFETSGTFVGNTTSVMDLFVRIREQFAAMYRKKAFVYQYTEEGMEENEFQEAFENMSDLINEYQQFDNNNINDDVYDESDDSGELVTEIPANSQVEQTIPVAEVQNE